MPTDLVADVADELHISSITSATPSVAISAIPQNYYQTNNK
ncbi:MAG TPA: hypothetical protein V6D35_09320 [Candidatus Sericytochromatia bacterium]